MSRSAVDAVVIGAGPYGLAAASHLRAAGAEVRVFGRTMSFWKRHMPRGMRLKSSWSASRIADPARAYTLEEFERVRGRPISRPIPLADFVAYGEWFQAHAVPEIDPRQVVSVTRDEPGFRVVLEDDEPIESDRVVVAAGIAEFAWRPAEFDGLPPELASHSSEHADLGRFAGRRVAVIGAGQSAVESAVLLHEAGADVEVIIRAAGVRWVGRATREGLLGRLLFDSTDVGPALVSHLVARPTLVRRLPPQLQLEVARRSLAAGASLWLRPRAADLRITAGRRVTQASRSNGHLALTLDDGATREVDHVLLATGYRVDVHRYRFLTPSLLAHVRCAEGSPMLDDGLESTVPGLHFLGAPGVHSFGPLVRFVSGTRFAAGALARTVRAGRRRAVARQAREQGFAVGAPEQGAR